SPMTQHSFPTRRSSDLPKLLIDQALLLKQRLHRGTFLLPDGFHLRLLVVGQIELLGQKGHVSAHTHTHSHTHVVAVHRRRRRGRSEERRVGKGGRCGVG